MCTRPKLVNVGRLQGLGFDRFKFAPCNMCLECRNMRREEFTVRLKHEIETSGYIASFVSLTYRDDELPLLLPVGSAVVGSYFGSVPPAFGSTLSRKDISQFCDKLSKRVHRKFGHGIKYVAVGEYGDDGHRPHFHLIVVGLPASERTMVYEAWNKGRVDIQPVGKGAIRYTLSYIDKQIFCPDTLYDYYGDFEPPFAHFSKGLGVAWINNHLSDFDKYGTYKSGDRVKSYTLNPYYRRKFGFDAKPYISVFSDSVYRYAEQHNLDLFTAYQQRCKVVERSLIHKQIKSREPIRQCSKYIIRKEYSRLLAKGRLSHDDYASFTRNMLNFSESSSPLIYSSADLSPVVSSPVHKEFQFYVPSVGSYNRSRKFYNIRS